VGGVESWWVCHCREWSINYDIHVHVSIRTVFPCSFVVCLLLSTYNYKTRKYSKKGQLVNITLTPANRLLVMRANDDNYGPGFKQETFQSLTQSAKLTFPFLSLSFVIQKLSLDF
jgi:hypothetical protein